MSVLRRCVVDGRWTGVKSREPVCSFCLRWAGREVAVLRPIGRIVSTPRPTAAQIRAAMAQDEAEMDGLIAAVVERLEEIAP